MSDDLYSDEPAATPHIDGIDAANFAAQGKPTKEQAKAVWDSMRDPSVRKVEAVLKQRGFDVSYRTIARWSNAEWREKNPVTDRASDARDAQRKRVRLRNKTPSPVQQALKQEVAAIPADELIAAQHLKQGDAPPIKTDDEELLRRRRDELMLMSETELDVQEAKARRVMNIMMMEQAGKRAHVMVLIPKDTAAFVEAMTEARRAMGTGIIDKPPGSEREGDGDIIDVTPNDDSQLTREINRYLKTEDMTV